MRVRLFDLTYGVRFLFGGRFKTPSKHRGKLSAWPDAPEADIREVLDHWAAQQRVAWAIARTLAWASLLCLICATGWLLK